MKIVAWNVNGIRACMRNINLHKFLKEQEADIFCMNEVKSAKPINDLKLRMTYKYQIWNLCQKKKGYSGTAILSKIKPLSVVKSPFDDEGRLICAEFEKFYLIVVYVPNSKLEGKRLRYRVDIWDTKMREFIASLKKPVVFTCDMNVVHKDIDVHNPYTMRKMPGMFPEERKSFGKYFEMGMVDSFRHFYPEEVKYSYWSYRTKARAVNRGWRIDYFLISKEFMENIEDSQILDDQIGSDHCPVKLVIK